MWVRQVPSVPFVPSCGRRGEVMCLGGGTGRATGTGSVGTGEGQVMWEQGAIIAPWVVA